MLLVCLKLISSVSYKFQGDNIHNAGSIACLCLDTWGWWQLSAFRNDMGSHAALCLFEYTLKSQQTYDCFDLSWVNWLFDNSWKTCLATVPHICPHPQKVCQFNIFSWLSEIDVLGPPIYDQLSLLFCVLLSWRLRFTQIFRCLVISVFLFTLAIWKSESRRTTGLPLVNQMKYFLSAIRFAFPSRGSKGRRMVASSVLSCSLFLF